MLRTYILFCVEIVKRHICNINPFIYPCRTSSEPAWRSRVTLVGSRMQMSQKKEECQKQIPVTTPSEINVAGNTITYDYYYYSRISLQGDVMVTRHTGYRVHTV